MGLCRSCKYRRDAKSTLDDWCKKGLRQVFRVSCSEYDYDYDYIPHILGEPANLVFADTITFDRANPFYLVSIPSIKNVIFNPPATIILWGDGTKTVVKCSDGETYDYEVGLAMCLCKRMLGKKYRRWFKDALKKGGMGWWK